VAAGETTVGGIVGFLRLDDDQFNRAVDAAIARIKLLDGMDADVDVRVDTSGIDRIGRAARPATDGLDSIAAASRRVEDATSRVRVAQTRLDDVRSRGRSSSVIDAEHSLRRALREENDAIWDTYAGNIRLGESNDVLERSTRRASRGVSDMGRSFRGLHDPKVILAAVAAGVAVLGPVAGATAGAVVGLTAVVGTGVLAWKGYQREIQNGTALGVALQQQLGGLTGTLHELEATAASATGPGLMGGLSKLDAYLPTLDGHVSTLGKSLGNALDVSADGVISGLKNMMPLLEDGGRWAEVLAHKFADFTQSQDFKDFIAYARQELPEVAQAIGDLTKGLIDGATALAPYGDAIVKTIGLIGDAMSVGGKAGTDIPGLPDLGQVFKWTSGVGLLGGAYDLLHGKTKSATEATAEYADTTQTSLAAIDAQSTAQSGLAGVMGTTFAALQAAEAAQRKTADATAAASVKMQIENDAAGILKQSLDALNGESLSAAEAQNAFDSSLVNMGDHTTATGKKIKFTTTSINNMSSASVSLRGQLNGQIANLQRVVEANGGLSDSTGKARKQMRAMRQQIIDNAVAHGVDRKAVTAYIDTFFKIPKKLPPTKLDVDKKAADTQLSALEAHLTAVTRARTAVINVEENYRITGQSPYERSAPGIGVRTLPGKGVRKAAGGTVPGSGSPTADDVPAWLSSGEEVINARSAKKHRALLKALNADKFAAGGTVGMATGGTVSDRIGAQYQNAIRLPDSGGVQKASDAITRLLAAWQKSIDDADAAARRLELVRAVAKASRKDVAAAKKELADFDRDQARERVKDSAARKQEILASRAQTLANRQSWAFDHMSTADQLKNITKRLNAEKAYTDEWMSLAQQREQVVTGMNDRLNQMLDQQVDINGRLADAEASRDSAIASANQSLAEQTRQLKDTRREALATWAALDEQATVGFAPSMSFLVSNAKDQVEQFTEWMSQLSLARSRGLSENAIALLGLDQGPQALAQLRQVNKGTADQVDQLNGLVAQRTQLAAQQADLEATGRLGKLGQDLLAAQQEAAQAIADAQAEFLATQQDLTAQLAAIGTDQARSYTDAIAQGLLSGLPAIQAAAAQVQAALTAMQATQAALDAGGKKSTKKPSVKRAGGGWVFGPGSSKSDSIDAALSNGEFVVNADAASRNAGLLTALNGGQSVSPIVPRVNVAAPVVHVHIDGQEFRGLVHVELGRAARAHAMTERRRVSA
jgi:hypothetical protein